MAVIAQYRFVGKDLGLLALAFPGIRVIKGPPFYPFVPDKRIIVVSEEEHFSRYPDKEIIQIISTATIALDTKQGFLSVLAGQGVAATDHQLRLLLEDFTDEEFWYLAKLAVVLKGFPSIPEDGSREQGATVFDLFDNLFEDFDKVYRIYWSLLKVRSREGILCSVIEMVNNAKNLNLRVFHPYYMKLLRKNRRYFPLFAILLEKFLLETDWDVKTERDDMDVLWLFAFCSAHTRPPRWIAYLKERDMIGFKLKGLGYSGTCDELEAQFRQAFPNLFLCA